LEDAYKLKGREAKKAVARMQRDIDEIYKYLSEQRIAVRPLLLEKKGLDVLLNEQKEKLARLLAKKEELLQQRAPLMEAVWESDADIIYESFNEGFTVNKNALVDVLANRTKWQVDLIADVFEKKYNVPLQQQISSKLSSTMGSLVAGSNKYLCKLIRLRRHDPMPICQYGIGNLLR
jgi:regulator of replication initiation timing